MAQLMIITRHKSAKRCPSQSTETQTILDALYHLMIITINYPSASVVNPFLAR